jgi:uncharacterized protein YjbI with pentapeptide repeats
MANPEHLAKLKEGVEAWNKWRDENPDVRPDLTATNLWEDSLWEADLTGANLWKADLREAYLWAAKLAGANLWEADLTKADLSRANLRQADLWKANLTKANLREANLSRANLRQADLTGANLWKANLMEANLSSANLREAGLSRTCLREADLREADLREARLREADLWEANLSRANLREANLSRANLTRASLYEANMQGADLTRANFMFSTFVNVNLRDANIDGCTVYGVSAWDLDLEDAKQSGLIVSSPGEPEITVDNIEVAQFIHLLLNNERIRHVIDTITSKVVLILGRFSEERKPVLDAIREELRKRDYLPVMFDFEQPVQRDMTETISILARMARFVIVDLTDPSCVPHELASVVPDLRSVPVRPIIEGDKQEYAMFGDFLAYQWVLPVYHYECAENLLPSIEEVIIQPAEAKVKELTGGEDKKK